MSKNENAVCQQKQKNGGAHGSMDITKISAKLIGWHELRSWPASVALLVVPQYVLLGYGDRRVWVQGPGWPDHCVRL